MFPKKIIISSILGIASFIIPAFASAAVYTSPPADGGRWGVYPNCIAPAVGVEMHNWWNIHDRVPEHIHTAACLPNARDIQNSVVPKINKPEKFVVRVMSYNQSSDFPGNPNSIDLSQWSWGSVGTPAEVVPVDLKCTGDVPSHKIVADHDECTWYVDMTLDPSSATKGIDELQINSAISNSGYGRLQSTSLNFQLPVEGKTGTFHLTTDIIGTGAITKPESARSFSRVSVYKPIGSANVSVGYGDLFKNTGLDRTAPMVSGIVPIRVKSEGLSSTPNVVLNIWQDMEHHNDPVLFKTAQVGDVGVMGGKLISKHQGNFDGTFDWDTRGLSDGRHTLYFQVVEISDQAIQETNASALLLFFDVCNSGSCTTTSQSLTNHDHVALQTPAQIPSVCNLGSSPTVTELKSCINALQARIIQLQEQTGLGFHNGDRVITDANLKIRSGPSTASTLVGVGKVNRNSTGTIACGSAGVGNNTCPKTTADGYTWWFIKWDSGLSGWSAQGTTEADFLTNLHETLATDININTGAPTIISTNLPNFTVGQPYQANVSAIGGSGSYTWSIVSGSLPSGLSLQPITCFSSPCQVPVYITGTPTTAGDGMFMFTIEVSAGGLSMSKEFMLQTSGHDTSTHNTTTNTSTDVSQPTAEQAELLRLINQNRPTGKLAWCPRLALGALYQTQDMVAGDVSGTNQHHLTGEGGSVQDYTFYARKAGYDTTGGNLSAQYYLGAESTTLTQVANEWSPVRLTAQTSNYNVVGVVHIGHHWTEIYGKNDNPTTACAIP